jgi:hypothetical protein
VVYLTLMSLIIDSVLTLGLITRNNYKVRDVIVLVFAGAFIPKPIIVFVVFILLKYILKYSVTMMQLLLIFVVVGSIELIFSSASIPLTLSIVIAFFIKVVFLFVILEDKEYVLRIQLTLLTHKYIIALLYFIIYVILQLK